MRAAQHHFYRGTSAATLSRVPRGLAREEGRRWRSRSNGAAGGVTGSRTLVQVRDKRVLVDRGLFQGQDDERGASTRLDFDVRTIDFALLTHAHLDQYWHPHATG